MVVSIITMVLWEVMEAAASCEINKAEKHCTLDACCVHAMCMCIYCAV